MAALPSGRQESEEDGAKPAECLLDTVPEPWLTPTSSSARPASSSQGALRCRPRTWPRRLCAFWTSASSWCTSPLVQAWGWRSSQPCGSHSAPGGTRGGTGQAATSAPHAEGHTLRSRRHTRGAGPGPHTRGHATPLGCRWQCGRDANGCRQGRQEPEVPCTAGGARGAPPKVNRIAPRQSLATPRDPPRAPGHGGADAVHRYSRPPVTAKRWKRPKRPSADERINKRWRARKTEYYSPTKKDGVLLSRDNMRQTLNTRCDVRQERRETFTIPFERNVQAE